MQKPKILIIKIGSNVLTTEAGKPDVDRMEALVSQVSRLKSDGIQIVLVSSGAVAFGRGEISLPEKTDPILKKQIWASTGQVGLINTYKRLFKSQGINISQILVTKEDFRDRKHYLNMRNCLLGLMAQGIVPIINENDAVAITELMFTDNDELASLSAAMVNADSMVLLTNVDGIFDGNPSLPGSKLIRVINEKIPELDGAISPVKSSFGRGGMLTKTSMALKAASLGIQVWIANGKRDNILLDVFAGEASVSAQRVPSTYFVPKAGKQSPKKWLAHGEQYFKGEVFVNEGAKAALTSDKISSLLPVGILSIKGNFAKGDIIRISDAHGEKIGLGKAAYGAIQATEKIGLNNQKPFIHYDYLYLFQDA